MKLYYATGTCSLSPHIVANEAGISLDLERVDISKTPHLTETGREYAKVNPNGYVPALEFDDGFVLTEGAAIAQYLADQKPESGLAPAAGTRARAELQSWLNFIAAEIHKGYGLLFHAEYGAQAQDAARAALARRLSRVEQHLAAGGPFLLGETFTAADAYLFTVVSWSSFVKVDLSDFSHLRDFLTRVGARPAVREAMRAEGMKVQ